MVPTTVDCSVRNGGCEYTCVRGTPDRCTCPTGLTLSPSQRTCVGKIGLSHSIHSSAGIEYTTKCKESFGAQTHQAKNLFSNSMLDQDWRCNDVVSGQGRGEKIFYQF